MRGGGGEMREREDDERGGECERGGRGERGCEMGGDMKECEV